MAKTKKILALIASVIIFFTMAFSFARCKNDDREDVRFYLLLGPVSKEFNTNDKEKVLNMIEAGVFKLLKVVDKDLTYENRVVTVDYDEAISKYLYIKYKSDSEDEFHDCSTYSA